ncbi:hypothetical protein DMB65_11960 [Flavobacterium cheongpyeongense]|jgi:hypothetical protein|uniref:Uncharacterized protein n=1 Tax=Flavobacterium cheongpyeongense TaxID=2212651 RepID=A0A2V4BNN1_9FLAO|nr:hypothetical protein [Flavobacterium cheongpyeongense]PXY40616.1 hypothetical protein DMB65_11960 [Flavobacterium cheongpyeongense]
MKNTILILASLFIFPSCKQNNNTKSEKMSNLTSKNYIETMLKTIKHYDYEPVYFLTYVQNVCYSEILVNDIPVHKNFTELGDGETMEINNYIFKSGLQKVTFRLYPAINGKDFDYKKFTDETDMKISISESDNINRDKKGKEIISYLTPTVDGVNENGPIKKFAAAGKTYYEASFTFEAKIPYEFDSLDKGQDLREWNKEKLEQKVVDFYKNQLTLLKEKKKEQYFSYLELKEKETCQSLFYDKKELQQILDAYLDAFTIPNYQMQPLENYKLKLYGDGRIVCLEIESSDNHLRGESALWAKLDEGDGIMADFLQYYLYIPEGEDELEILR